MYLGIPRLARILLVASAAILMACTGPKKWTYTRSIYPVFLDDSTAAIFLMDYTETEKFMEPPRVTHVTLRSFRVNYRAQSPITRFAEPVPAGDLGYGPDFSLTQDLLFITGSHARTPFIAIDWKTGKVEENTKEICCARRLDDWFVEGTYYFHSDSGTFRLLDLRNRKLSDLNPDTLFAFSPERWHDLDFSVDRISATFASGDSLWLVDMGMSDRDIERIPLPPPPENLRRYRELEVTFAPNSGYLRVGLPGGGGLVYMVPLEVLRSAPGSAEWVSESGYAFNRDVSAKSSRLREYDRGPLDSTHVLFLDREGNVLVDYDFSSHIRK